MSRKNYYRPLGLFLILALLVGGIPFTLTWFVFRPSARLSHTPAALGLSFEDVTLTTSDNVRLHGWYVPANEKNSRAELLFFHGNAGNISNRLDSIEIFHNLGLSVFIFDYRGYGQSGGRPSVAGTALDARAAWQWLTEEKKIPPGKVVVFGRSLGGAIAMELMRSEVPGALILESTFSSLSEMVRIPFMVPLARHVTGDAWNSAEAARTLTVPALCIHSPDDRLVPYQLGRSLYNAVGSEKTFLEISGGHNEGFLDSIDTYVPALDAFLTKRFGRSQSF
ncbi:MAG: alpha/beta hydrolase [Synergistaceae bacterium]|nr:alpha/beta hydrolase [Synergistaceae bacterium]